MFIFIDADTSGLSETVVFPVTVDTCKNRLDRQIPRNSVNSVKCFSTHPHIGHMLACLVISLTVHGY